MCGIAGFVNARPTAPDPSLLERITDTLRHRGPDDLGYYQDDLASLGHRRLSIIDLATGRQPIASEDGNLRIVYNGEIFNHLDLREQLIRAGHHYATRSDTETIIHAFEQYGSECVHRFRGMFAFAIWDRGARRLFCARDRLGKKPFYYYWDGSLFAFASEIKALLRHPAISASFDESVLAEYLSFGYVSDERTLFERIRKLMPGHWLTLDVSAERPILETRQYWDIPAPAADDGRPDGEWIRECRERLDDTVRMRLMSDVPLGMFLSGGLDSSAVAALIKRSFAGPVKTYAVGYKEAAFSELAYAREVAARIGTDHHEIVVGMEQFFEALPKLVWHEDEPPVWPSSVPLYFVSRLAARDVKVVLTGEGSDELFAGYGRYRHYLWNDRWQRKYGVVPAPLRRAIRSRVGTSSLLSAAARRKFQHTFVGLGDSLDSLYLDNFYSAFPATERGALRAGCEMGAYTNFLRYWNQRAGDPLLSRMLFTDQKTYLVELLMKQDQMSMAASIESRVPFLDHELVEFSTLVPDRLKLRGRQGKYIVKKAVEDLLPRDIVYRTKMGFPTPLRDWLRDPRADGLLSGLTASDGLLAAYLDLAQVAELVERQRSGRHDATDRIWRLLTLQLWGDIFITGRRRDVAETPTTRMAV